MATRPMCHPSLLPQTEDADETAEDTGSVGETAVEPDAGQPGDAAATADATGEVDPAAQPAADTPAAGEDGGTEG